MLDDISMAAIETTAVRLKINALERLHALGNTTITVTSTTSGALLSLINITRTSDHFKYFNPVAL